MFDDTDTTQRLYGKYPGIVVDNQPQAGAGRFQGEIKVKVSSMLDENRRPIEAWARPCFHPGFFFIPEVGDNVWVEFVAGDIDFPIWSGVWYPQGKTPKTSDNQAPVTEQKVIRTAAGHVVELDDSDGAEKVVISHKAGSTIEIDKDGKITITDAGNDTSIVSRKISLGTKGGASEKVVLGDTLKSKLEELIDIMTRHVHPTGVGPSGPPATEAASLAALRVALIQILSQQNTTD